MILAAFSSCCCYEFWLPFPPAAGCCCCWSPDRKTPWQWRTEKPQNCTPKMPNVTSETHRKWWVWLLFPLAAAMNMNFGYLFLLPLQRFCCCCCWSPDRKTPWQWRTEKPQNCTPEMPNVTSETHRKWWFWLLFPLAAAMKIWKFWLKFPPAAAEAFAAAAGPEVWLPFPPAGPRIGKHHGSEGRRSPKIAPPKMPNVTSETHRKWWFWLLFSLAAAMNMKILATFSSCHCRSFRCCWSWSLATFSSCWSPDRKTPWQWRTEKPQNCTPKNA